MKKRQARPNIVFIMTDQQRADTIAALGYEHMHTPHMDSLVDEGVSFTRAFCPAATCVPSRAAVFTGIYAHNTGCYTFDPWAHHRNFVHELNDSGYWCANIGKMHLSPRDTPAGFHERVVVENPTNLTVEKGGSDDDWGKYLSFHGEQRPNHRQKTDPEWDRKFQCVPWHLDEKLHSDVFAGDSAASWIRSYAVGKQPFFLEIGFPGPHEPWDPPARFLEHYKDDWGTLPPSLKEDLSKKPPQHRAHQEFMANADGEARIRMQDATEEDIIRMRRHYFGKISLVDEQVGKVLEALEEKGLRDNTIIVFTSDHGEMLGEHGLAYKWLLYDSIVRVPLIVVDPRETSRKGVKTDDLVSLIDLGPTLLEYAGVKVPTRMEGMSLGPAVRGEPYLKRETVYAENNTMLMCRSSNKKMVYYLGQPEGEFYDLDQDPFEMDNLWDEPGHREEITRWKVHLLEWLAGSNYHQLGHRCGKEDEERQYPLRWPRPEEGDYYLHGPNAKPPAVPYH